MNGISAFYVRKRAELLLKNPYTPLPDIIQNTFPKIYMFTPDYFLLTCILYSIIYYKNLIEIEKNILCIGICTIIRSFSVFITLMPTCMPKPQKTNNIYKKIFLSTHDLMFSGHTLFFIGIGNMLDNFYIKYTGPLLLIIARQHYTIDILVSFLVYYHIYYNLQYFNYLENIN